MRQSKREIHSFEAIAKQIRLQFLDVIDYFSALEENEAIVRRYKNFDLICSDAAPKEKLGDYTPAKLKDGKSTRPRIRLFYLKALHWENVLLCGIHELAHHIDYCQTGATAHDTSFYYVYRGLLNTALDMGIITPAALARHPVGKTEAKELTKMLAMYRPQHLDYRPEPASVLSVYISYEDTDTREMLKQRGYRWNKLDKAWSVDILDAELEAEMRLLDSYGVGEDQIALEPGLKPVTRFRPIIQVYDFLYAYRQQLIDMGYRQIPKIARWEKNISEPDFFDLDAEEQKIHEICPDAKIVISWDFGD